MAEILIKSNLFSPSCPHLPCFSFSPKNSSLSSVSGFSSLKLQPLRSSSNSDFHGQRIFLQQVQREPIRGNLKVLSAQMGLIGKSHKWWEKGLQSNMKDITSAQDLVDSLFNAGDKLVIIDFFSPGCGGCKALHPKICQFAEMNPDVQFLKVNYEELKCMCYSLNVHVLPFFRFYRGAHGRLCSFSCTNATIKKFKDALAKHTTDRCSLGPSKGLEESELLALAANKDLSFNYIPKVPLVQEEEKILEPIAANLNFNLPSISKVSKDSEEKSLVTASR